MNHTIKNITRGVTFRIPEQIIDSLEKFADTKQISVNTLANQIFKNYVEWDSTAVNAGWVVFPKPAIKELIDKMPLKDLELIAKNEAEYHKDMQLLMLGEQSIMGLLIMLKQHCNKSGFSFTETIKENNIIHFIIQHDLGDKFSFFNKILYTKMVNDLGYKLDMETTKNTVALHISPTYSTIK